MSSIDPQEQYRQNEARMAEIEAETKKQPLASEIQPISTLFKLYEDNPGWTSKLQSLQYDIRTVRGDGNCFYRAFLYSLVENLINNNPEAVRVRQALKDAWKSILELGYDEFALEVFYDTILEILNKVAEEKLKDFHVVFNEENSTSDYCTWFLRVVVSSALKKDPDRFLPFLDGMDIDTFCSKFVEPMGKECDNIQIICLAEAFGVGLHLEYLDTNSTMQHNFGPDSASIKLYMLYRPGHYDILYPISK